MIFINQMKKRKYKRWLHINSPRIDEYYFQLERRIHPNFHDNNNYDYLMSLWKVACQMFKWGVRK